MPSSAFNVLCEEDVFIVIECITPDEVGVLSPHLYDRYNEQARKRIIRKHWRSSDTWVSELKILCEYFIYQLLEERMEYHFNLEASSAVRKFDRDSTYAEFEVYVLAFETDNQIATYGTQFRISVNFDKLEIIKEKILF